MSQSVREFVIRKTLVDSTQLVVHLLASTLMALEEAVGCHRLGTNVKE